MRTAGQNNKGLLGLGNDVSSCSMFRKVNFKLAVPMTEIPEVYAGNTNFFVKI